MIFNLPDVYKHYCLNKKNPVSAKVHRNICIDFNDMVFKELREGKIFNIGFNLSNLEIILIERNFKRPRINIYETRKLRDAGIDDTVYWTDDFYCRHFWNKYKCKVKNRKYYQFSPTRGLKGNKGKLVTLLKTDKFSYLRFRKVDEV